MPAIVVRWPFTRPPAADTKAALMMWLEEGERGEGRKNAIALLRQGDVLFPDRDRATTVLVHARGASELSKSLGDSTISSTKLGQKAVPMSGEFC